VRNANPLINSPNAFYRCVSFILATRSSGADVALCCGLGWWAGCRVVQKMAVRDASLRVAEPMWWSRCRLQLKVTALGVALLRYLVSRASLCVAAARVKPAAASFFGAQRSDDILKDASGSCTSDASAACTRGSVEVWGWGCNARGQLGPLAPSGSVVLQPQRLHVLSAGARLDSIGESCGFSTSVCFASHVGAVAGMHHTAIFTREVKAGAGGSPASQKGVDVVRCSGAD
jgi:hypothetical protein